MMKKRKVIIAAGLAAVLGTGATAAAFGGANRIICVEDGSRQVFQIEDGQMTEVAETVESTETAESTETTESAEAGTGMQMQLESVRMWGTVTGTDENRFSFNSQTTDSYQGEVVIYLDPEQTLILDSTTGYPADQDQIVTGSAVTLYAGPAMTMSIPPQMTAVVVFVNIPADGSTPLYGMAADLADDGEGGYLLTMTDGQTIAVPADCQITPYLTRQTVTLQDLTGGKTFLVWLDADGAAERIVLFNS